MRTFGALALLLILLSQVNLAKSKTGFFLSLGSMHYQVRSLDSANQAVGIGEPSDLYFGLSLDLNRKWEVNLVYNRSTEGFSSNPEIPTFDKDGLSFEFGKLLDIPLLRRDYFTTYIEFVGGAYFTIYPFKKSSLPKRELYGAVGNEIDRKLFSTAGFYWAIRLNYLISNRVSILIGYKSLIPVRSNEFTLSRGVELLLTKSFLTLGVSF